MASVYNNISNTTSASSIRGFGGLASGLDRDSLIEGMTAATRAKIAKQQKSKQTMQWKQDAYRSISSKLIEFSRKYTSYTNPETNLASAAFWTRSNVTPTGINSKYIQVTGSPTSSSNISIAGVEQLAKKASVVSSDYVTSGALTTGELKVDEMTTVSTLAGESLKFKVNDKTYNVQLGNGNYSNATEAVKSIKEALKGIAVGGRTLADIVDVEAETGTPDAENAPFKLNFKSIDGAGNTVSMAGGSDGALKALGFESQEAFATLAEQGKTVMNGSGFDMPQDEWNNIKAKQDFFKELSFQDRVNGKKMTFTYNGVSKSITLEYDPNEPNALDKFAADIENKLAKEFGSGRIAVSITDGQLQFKTQKPNASGEIDYSSELSISSADAGLLGTTGALKVEKGQSNRLNLDVAVGQSGLKNIPSGWDITINGKTITGIDSNSTMNDIINKINSSDAGVTVTYMKNADCFSIVSNEEGASGSVKLSNDAAMLFGAMKEDGTALEGIGQDAIINVRYGDSADTVKLTRGSNTFTLEGMNVTVSGTFNKDGDDKSQEVILNAKADSDKIVKAVTDMIKDYNALIKLVNDEISTKPNRNYGPLTDEQKAEMKDSQIEKWETEAKKGLLFGDSELRSLSDSMRFVFGVGSSETARLEALGFSKSTDYSENGAIVFNEEKFRTALENSGEELQDLFTRSADASTGDQGGVMKRLTGTINKYASVTGASKGSLVEKAGSVYAPSSILSNTLKKSMDEVDKYISRLQSQLKVETDRYIKQFTSLETVIAQMNSQSSWLQSSFGG
ncbi:flagellar filament capping protein FliD [Lacrimispora sp. BS-2]|uniref:Flagellar hook-associated protein 2 n=1 Tax=Lacrimispora sp. BS-2 TaxID=3151850 RepID=A0AAU7PQ61_9FIRM